jgi:hypothetical protein
MFPRNHDEPETQIIIEPHLRENKQALNPAGREVELVRPTASRGGKKLPGDGLPGESAILRKQGHLKSSRFLRRRPEFGRTEYQDNFHIPPLRDSLRANPGIWPSCKQELSDGARVKLSYNVK